MFLLLTSKIFCTLFSDSDFDFKQVLAWLYQALKEVRKKRFNKQNLGNSMLPSLIPSPMKLETF